MAQTTHARPSSGRKGGATPSTSIGRSLGSPFITLVIAILAVPLASLLGPAWSALCGVSLTVWATLFSLGAFSMGVVCVRLLWQLKCAQP